MKKPFRSLRWIGLGVGLLLFLLAIVLGVYANTEHFRRLVREQLVTAINRSIQGSISLDRIQGSIWGSLTLHDVRLRYHDADVVQVPQLKLRYALLPLLWGQFTITRAEATAPSVQLVRDGQGRWNIVEALTAQGEAGSDFAVQLKGLSLRQGKLDLVATGAPFDDIRLRALMLDGRLVMGSAGLNFDVSRLNTRLELPRLPAVMMRGSLAYREAGSVSSIDVRGLSLATAASQLRLDGQLTGFGASKIVTKLAIEKLAGADIVSFLPKWPKEHDLSGTITAQGPFDALNVVTELAAANAQATSKFIIDITAASPTYRGAVKITGLNLRKLPFTERLGGVLDGRAELQGVGFAINELQGSGAFDIRHLQVQDWALGDLRLRTDIRAGKGLFSGDLKGQLGGADWRGEVSLSEAPKYDFAFAVHNLDIKKASTETNALGGVLSFKGSVKGSGIKIAELDARTNLQLLASKVGPLSLRDGEVVATISGGRLRITRGSLNSADSTLILKGEIGLNLQSHGKLDYEFRTKNLAPWLKLADISGSGSLTLAGNAQGSLDTFTTRGRIQLSRIKLDGMAVDHGGADFALVRKSDQAVPDGRVTLQLAGLHAGFRLQKLDATANLSSRPSPAAQIEAQAQDPFGRVHSIKATVNYTPAELLANVSQVVVNLPDGTWSLAQPAAFSKRGNTLQVQNFKLRNRERQATLDGTVALSGPQALNLTVDNFPIESLAPFLPKQAKITGILRLQAQVSGTAAAPEITAALKLTDSTIGGHSYTGLSGDLSYRRRQANLEVTLRQDPTHALTARGRLPMELSWDQGWRSRVSGELDLRAESPGLSLAFINVYSAKTISDLDGQISFDLVATGALAEPNLSGTFQIKNGKLKANLVNVEIQGIALDGSFDARALRVKNISARANDGGLSGTGSLTIKNYQIEKFNFLLAARRWPAINTRRYQAEIDGEVEIAGPLPAPKLSGQIVVTEANIRPDLTFLESSSTSVKRDETIVVVNRAGTPVPTAMDNHRNNGLGESDLFKQLAIDVIVSLPRNVWVRHPDAAAELRGKIRAAKNSGGPLQLVGAAEIIRGWAAFQGRRFNFERGRLEFVGGGKLDPTLDIVARHRLPQYTVDAVVGGTATKPTLTLRSDPSLDQADILAVLLFGKPTADLNRSEEAALKQNAIDVTAGFAAARIGAAVAQAAGLDELELGNLEFGADRVGVGRYVESQTYVTVQQQLAGERGQEVAVEYQLAPDWKIGTSTTSSGSSEAQLIWQKRY